MKACYLLFNKVLKICNLSWGLKSKFIVTGAIKEAITDIENYWYDDLVLYMLSLPLSIDLGVHNGLV